jgi:hypothetical protein
MLLPSSEYLRANISCSPPDHHQRLQNLKISLRTAYNTVRQANKRSHQQNKELYDRKAKLRSFEIGSFVYLCTPAVKPGLSRKFHRPWSGPYRVTAKVSHLNYEIEDQSNKKQVVHVNRLKQAYNADTWQPKTSPKAKKKRGQKPPTYASEEEDEVRFGPFPMLQTACQERENEPRTPPDRVPNTPVPQTVETPAPEHGDPTYAPSETPRSRRELQPTRTEPPITRSRTWVMSQDQVANVN